VAAGASLTGKIMKKVPARQLVTANRVNEHIWCSLLRGANRGGHPASRRSVAYR
jgi:hypothetical protein